MFVSLTLVISALYFFIGLDKSGDQVNILLIAARKVIKSASLFSTKTYVMGTH